MLAPYATLGFCSERMLHDRCSLRMLATVAECLASVSFESRPEDAVDEACLAMDHLGFLKRMRRREILVPAFMVALLIAIFIALVFRDVRPGNLVLIAALIGTGSAVFYAASYRSRFEFAVRRRLAQLGRLENEPVVVSLYSDLVEVARPRVTVRFLWREVQSVRTRKGSVLLFAENNVVVVRDWAFANNVEFERFRDLALSLAEAARRRSS